MVRQIPQIPVEWMTQVCSSLECVINVQTCTRSNDGTLISWFCMTFFKSLRTTSPKFVDYFLLNNFSSVFLSLPHHPHICLDMFHPPPKHYCILLTGSCSHVSLHIVSEYFLMYCWHHASLGSKPLHHVLRIHLLQAPVWLNYTISESV